MQNIMGAQQMMSPNTNTRPVQDASIFLEELAEYQPHWICAIKLGRDIEMKEHGQSAKPCVHI